MRGTNRRCLVLAAAAALWLAGCPGGGANSGSGAASSSVVLYCAADREIAQDVLKEFEKQSGIHVDSKWDTEAAKTVGLAQALEAEREHPRADVFWAGEPLRFALLAEKGVLAPAPADVVAAIGSAPHDEKGRWLGFSARVRVLIVNTAALSSDAWPKSYRDLSAPRFKGRVGIANPLFGSNTAYVAAMIAKLGEPEARRWLEELRSNEAAICAGNADVKNRVASGELWAGFTDSDDAHVAVADGRPVRIVFPDQEPGGLGTLFLPSAVGIVAGAPHPEEAAKLVRFLVSEPSETMLAAGDGQQIPLASGSKARPDWIPAELHPMDVSWSAVAAAHERARVVVQETLLRGR
jgi:iron(III) transport system substrate-binding protein